MAGAIVTHVVILHNSPMLAIILMTGLVIVAYVRRRELAAKVAASRA